jgi:hypothetical protein
VKACTKGICTRLTAILLVAVMGFWISNRILFMHTHVLDDGTRIGHAHPYDKSSETSPFKTHRHTRDSLFFFQSAATLFFAALIVLTIPDNFNTRISWATLPVRYPSGRIILLKGRAPPALIS